MLNLNKPIYEKTAAYGHFGRHQMMDHFLGKKLIKLAFFLNSFY